MKTIGIVTINDYTNYGNRLQNFALTKLLEEQGFRVVNGIRVSTKRDYVLRSDHIIKRLLKQLIPYRFLKDYITPKPVQRKGLLSIREEGFIRFTNSYSETIPTITANGYREVMQKLSKYGIYCYIAGSDQIWNPTYEGRNDEFLTFAPKNMRFSFSASIGVDEIPTQYRKQYQRNLNDMFYLSVREERAVEIISELTGRDADLTLDPTLLLEAEQWQRAVKRPDIALATSYICTYFLGEMPDAVNTFAQEKGLPIYALNSESFPELFTLDPGEFLYMIQHAVYLLTDSFHAVAFSIKFHKEFYVFNRKQAGVASMFSRIETITKRFGLENRIQNRDRIVEQELIAHWKKIDEELLCEKVKSMKRLIDAMGMN